MRIVCQQSGPDLGPNCLKWLSADSKNNAIHLSMDGSREGDRLPGTPPEN